MLSGRASLTEDAPEWLTDALAIASRGGNISGPELQRLNLAEAVLQSQS